MINPTKQIMVPGILTSSIYVFEWLQALQPMFYGLCLCFEARLQWDRRTSQSGIPEVKQL